MEYYEKDEERFGPITSRLYDLLAFAIPSMRRFYAFVISDIESSRARRVLDVGFGPGKVALAAARNKKMEVYGVEPSQSMLKIAKGRAGGAKNVHLEIGSSRKVPFHTKFDLIFSSISFHHWHDRNNSLRYLNRFLRKGGEIRIYEFQRGGRGITSKLASHSVSKGELYDAARGSGLKIKGMLERENFIRAAFVKSGN